MGYSASAFTFNLQGFEMVDPFVAPLWKSASPTDFWGRRWNTMMNQTLHTGVYGPLKGAGYNTTVSILAAFLVSGLVHDYCWAVLFYHGQDDAVPRTFTAKFGKQLAFFGWCGLTMLLERPVGQLPMIQWMSKNLPRVVVSILIVFTAVPLAHWYTGDWIEGGFVQSTSQAVFVVRYRPGGL